MGLVTQPKSNLFGFSVQLYYIKQSRVLFSKIKLNFKQLHRSITTARGQLYYSGTVLLALDCLW